MPAGILPEDKADTCKVMNKTVYQLTYRSKATEKIGQEQIMEIVDEAIAFNRRHDITGCLLFDQGYFLQILEGEKQTVNTLYQKIKKDPRHLQIDILSKGMSSQRIFTAWNMGFVNMQHLEIGQRMKLLEQARSALDTISIKDDFTPKVFWYNVFHLLSGSKFYRDTDF